MKLDTTLYVHVVKCKVLKLLFYRLFFVERLLTAGNQDLTFTFIYYQVKVFLSNKHTQKLLHKTS